MKFILIFTVLCLPLFAQDEAPNFDILKKMLRSKNPEVRLGIVEKLKELGLRSWLIRGKEKEYFSLLAMAFQDEDNTVASRAAHTFNSLFRKPLSLVVVQENGSTGTVGMNILVIKVLFTKPALRKR